MRLAIIPAAALALGLWGAALARAEGPDGVAFAEAPENSAGHCFGGDPETAFACAREACLAGGDGLRASDCKRVKWCFPARWSGDVALQNREGPHWHEYLCGWDSRAAVEAAAALSCDRTRRSDLVECALTRVWDPEGREIPQE